MVIRVLIADNNQLVRQVMDTLLELTDDMLLVGQAANGLEALTLIESTGPDVVVMDLRMPKMDGVAATAAIHRNHPEVGVLILTSSYDVRLIEAALEAGASAQVFKSGSVDDILMGIRFTYNLQQVMKNGRIN
jgi:DNA-binding NarL/FixJ family response regulator